MDQDQDQHWQAAAECVVTLKIRILGSGPVGRSLGTGFASNDYEVKLGSRIPGKRGRGCAWPLNLEAGVSQQQKISRRLRGG